MLKSGMFLGEFQHLFPFCELLRHFRNSSGSFATFTAIRLASSPVKQLGGRSLSSSHLPASLRIARQNR
jgi:hypothetical protein